jgi:anti-sigma regulatory factor (Ser/Thr protein kinase)
MTIRAGDTAGERANAPSRRGLASNPPSFRHEALLYDDMGAFVDATTAFIEDGLNEDSATLVVLSVAKIAALRAALGPACEAVAFADMATVGANPARIIPAWSDFVASHAGSGRPLRGVGEPIWAERTPAEMAECHIHESLLNLAFGEGAAFWLLCPYDTASLDRTTLQGACRTHAFVQSGTAHLESEHFSPSAADLMAEPLSPIPAQADAMDFVAHALSDVRQFVARHALTAGLSPDRTAELTIAVNELMTNSVIHAEGGGRLTVWREDDTLLCEVSDHGTFDRPLAGRVRPGVSQPGGRGLWLVNQVCDLVQLRGYPHATVVRVHQHLRSPRRMTEVREHPSLSSA